MPPVFPHRKRPFLSGILLWFEQGKKIIVIIIIIIIIKFFIIYVLVLYNSHKANYKESTVK
jgi:hypothetical protein